MFDPIVSEKWRSAVPYKEVGMLKVADMEAIALEIQKERRAQQLSMFINVAAIKVDKFKELNNTIRFCTDPINSVMYGLMIGTLADGNIKWRGVILSEMNTYNLNLLNDAILYAFVRMHPKVEGSPFQLEEPVFRIIDQEKIAAQKNAKYVLAQQAGHIAKTMKKDDILAFGRYLGISYPTDASSAIIRSTLFEHAYKQPKDFMEKYANPSRKYYEVVQTARTVGIITFEYDKGYKFRNLSLGYTESDVIAHFIEDPSLFDSIRSESNKRDITGKNLLKEKDTNQRVEVLDNIKEIGDDKENPENVDNAEENENKNY